MERDCHVLDCMKGLLSVFFVFPLYVDVSVDGCMFLFCFISSGLETVFVFVDFF